MIFFYQVNVWMIDIWKDKSAPFVQALQFFWSVGFIVSPLISNPFLSPEKKNEKTIDILPHHDHLRLIQDSELHIPYIVAGSICLIGSISLLVIYLIRRIEHCAMKNRMKNDENFKQSNNVIKEDKKPSDDDFDNHPDLEYTKTNVYIFQVLLFCSIITSVFCASEMTTFQYASTFAVKLDLGLSKKIGAMMMTIVATSFAVSFIIFMLVNSEYLF